MGRHSLASKKVRDNFFKSFKMVKIINVLGLALVGAAMANPPTRKEAKAVFKDDDEELLNYVESEDGSSEDAGDILDSADSNGDGQLNFAEFWKYVDGDDNRWLTVNFNFFG